MRFLWLFRLHLICNQIASHMQRTLCEIIENSRSTESTVPFPNFLSFFHLLPSFVKLLHPILPFSVLGCFFCRCVETQLSNYKPLETAFSAFVKWPNSQKDCILFLATPIIGRSCYAGWRQGQGSPPRCSDVIQLKLVDISQNHVVAKAQSIPPPRSTFATKTGKKKKTNTIISLLIYKKNSFL